MAEENGRVAAHKPWRMFQNPDWWMVVLTVALVVVTYLSLKVIRGQLDEMKAGGEQTDRMLSIAATQAEAAKRSADAATSAAETARRTLLLSERAWVGVVFARIDPLVLNAKAHAEMWVQNSSRGVATHIHVRSGSGFYEGDLPSSPPFATRKILPSDRILLPGDKFRFEIFSEDLPTAAELAKVSQMDLRWRFYTYAEISYFDVFGSKHSTKFCGYYDPRANGNLITCASYNVAD